jgi:adenylosuccinate lyase
MNKSQTTDNTDVPDAHSGYRSPLETRNASIEMRGVFSARRKFGYWRRIWLALAEAQRELGLPIESAQIDGLRAALDDFGTT